MSVAYLSALGYYDLSNWFVAIPSVIFPHLFLAEPQVLVLPISQRTRLLKTRIGPRPTLLGHHASPFFRWSTFPSSHDQLAHCLYVPMRFRHRLFRNDAAKPADIPSSLRISPFLQRGTLLWIHHRDLRATMKNLSVRW